MPSKGAGTPERQTPSKGMGAPEPYRSPQREPPPPPYTETASPHQQYQIFGPNFRSDVHLWNRNNHNEQTTPGLPPPRYTPNGPIIIGAEVRAPPRLRVPGVHFEEDPVQVTCPACKNDCTTLVLDELGMFGTIWMCVTGFFLLIFLIPLPMYLKSFRDAVHYCPYCFKQELGRYHRGRCC